MKVVKNSSAFSTFLFNFISECKSKQTRCTARKRKSDFTRTRIVSVYDLLCFLIFRHQNTMNRDLSVFFSKAKRITECVSKQAMNKALQKLNPNVFSKLFKDFRTLFYSSNLVKTYKGYVILSEDGTFLEIPFSYPNIMYYGYIQNQHVSSIFNVKKVVGKAGGLYDVTNGFFVDFIIRPANYSEIPIAIQHLYRIKETMENIPSIFLADRYYGSVELISLLEMIGMRYCIRAKSNFYKDKVASIEKDEWITLDIDEKWLKRFRYGDEIKNYVKNTKQIKIRVVKETYKYIDKDGNEQDEQLIYFTNLDEKEFNHQEIVHLYEKRWEIETGYKNLKITQEIERVNTTKQSVIECKIYAKILLFNIVNILKAELDYELIKKKTKIYCEGYRSNYEFLYQLCKENLYGIFVDRKFSICKLKKTIREILIAGDKKIVPIRKNRHYQRWGKFLKSPFYYRYRTDGRNNPKVRNYHGGLMTVRR